MQHDYDEYYDTKVSRPYGKSKLGCLLGCIMVFIGAAELSVTIADMFVSEYNLNYAQSSAAFVYTWDENPFWPTYGKGFWVGLVLMVTGLLGVVSSCEHTLASIYTFAAFSVASLVFNFYLMISALIPVGIYAWDSTNVIFNWGVFYYNSLALNATLVALGGFATILCTLAALLTCCLVGCCKEKRGQGGDFLETYYDSPAGGYYYPNSIAQPQYQAY